MSRQKRRSRSDVSDVTDTSNDTEAFNDVVLIVEGKKIPANGGILAYNSSVLGDMITCIWEHGSGAGQEFGDIGSTMVSRGDRGETPRGGRDRETPRGRAAPVVEVILKDQSYGTVKTMMGFLQTKYCKSEPLSGETALQLLPLTETYKIKRLKKRCTAAILDELDTMRSGKPSGSIPTSVTLKYLAAADKYGLDKVAAICIDECAANFDTTTRKEIADDKHISDKTKVAILDKMCDNLGTFYDNKLGKMKKEMNNKCKEIEEKRDNYKAETKEWQEGFQEEVDEKIKNKKYRELYENLLEQFEQTRKHIEVIEKEVANIDYNYIQVINPLKELSEKIKEEIKIKAKEDDSDTESMINKIVFQLDEDINDAFLDHIVEIKDRIEESMKCYRASITSVGEISTEYFSDAIKNFEVGLFQDQLTSTYSLHDRLDSASAELDDKLQEMMELEALYEKEKRQHEKTRAALVKQTKKVHKINTWLKWAKPVDDDEQRCTCFRHMAAGKRVYNT